MKYTKDQLIQIEKLNKVNELSKKVYIDILKASIIKAENMKL
jgi:hypothetical protein